jgi:hypothetical protein
MADLIESALRGLTWQLTGRLSLPGDNLPLGGCSHAAAEEPEMPAIGAKELRRSWPACPLLSDTHHPVRID